MNDLIWTGYLAIIFASFFTIGEIAHRRGVNSEVTRKFAHFVGSITTIFFPFIFSSHWTVLVLTTLYALFVYCCQKYGFIQSVHGVERESYGAILHPVAVYLCFLYSNYLNQPYFYVIAMLILAVSDALAALVGKKYGTKKYLVKPATKKSVEGSVAFFVTSFLIAQLVLLLSTSFERLECILVALVVSTLVTLIEAISPKGTDNLFVPLGTMYILSNTTSTSTNEIIFKVVIPSLFIIGYLIFFTRKEERQGA